MVLSNRLARGDRFRADIKLNTTGTARTIEDGTVTGARTIRRVEREGFVDSIMEVDDDGVRAKVRRTYVVSTITEWPAGGRARPTTRPMQGRTFTISGPATEPQVDNALGLSNTEIQDVLSALRDNPESLVVSGTHSVGDTWPVPQQFYLSLNMMATGKGTCRLDAVEGTGRGQRVRISFRAAATTLNAEGRVSNLSLSGSVDWSPALQRVTAYQFSGPVTTLFTSRLGAVSTRVEMDLVIGLSANLVWQQVNGKAAGPAK